jgi:hypothetical protein
MSVVLSDPREVREFVQAKKRKREPIRWHAEGVTEAKCEPRTLADFTSLRVGMRETVDFGRASEQLDALESALFFRHSLRIPKPRKVMQNTDRSISIWWRGVMVRCFQDGFVSLIGGPLGLPSKRITNELLDCLAQMQRKQ